MGRPMRPHRRRIRTTAADAVLNPFTDWWARLLYHERVRAQRGTKIAEYEVRQIIDRCEGQPNIRVVHEGRERACPAPAIEALRAAGFDTSPALPLFDD